MKRYIWLLAVAGLVAIATTRPALRADGELTFLRAFTATPAAANSVSSDEVIVHFRDSADDRIAARYIREGGGAAARRSRYGRRYLVNLDAGFTTAEALARYRTMPDVDYAEPVHWMYALQTRPGFLTPNDPSYTSRQWNFRIINAERMWGIQQGDPSVAVAVVDTGIAFEDFGPFRKAPDWGSTMFLPGFNVFTGTSHANDDEGHGTHVSSTIAEATDNGILVAGLAFHTSLMPVKVLDASGRGSDFDVAEGIDYAAGFTQGGVHPVKVINLSLGGPGISQTLRRSIDNAVANGITVVAASGNDGGGVGFPASLPNVITVGAMNCRKQRSSFSNFGPELDVVAPGGDVVFTSGGLAIDRCDDGSFDAVFQQDFLPPRFEVFGLLGEVGTSMATPHVAALAALLWRQGITDPRAIQTAIENSAEDLGSPGRDDQTGHGMIRPDLALRGYGLNQ